MFDTHGRTAAAISKHSVVEFLRVQLSPAIDGSFFVGVTATSVDEPEIEHFELIDQELVSNHVATIEAALAVISEHARRTFPATVRMES